MLRNRSKSREPSNGFISLEADSFRHLPIMGKNEGNYGMALVIISDEPKE